MVAGFRSQSGFLLANLVILFASTAVVIALCRIGQHHDRSRIPAIPARFVMGQIGFMTSRKPKQGYFRAVSMVYALAPPRQAPLKARSNGKK